MNTSMTINATAAWLLALYVAHATDMGVDPAVLAGTTQNDIVKEYLSRGTYIFPPEASRRLTVDTIAWAAHHAPRWNPINVCSYHLQEAGATPVQELAYALATAIGVLDAVLASGQIDADEFPAVVGRISFFVNAGIRFVEETCKMRAFTRLWDRICQQRYHVEDPKQRRFRYGVQVNSLGLTEAAAGEQRPAHRPRDPRRHPVGRARARAVQLPAWNEALGLPRPWDQQWSLRIQQVLAFETDLLEYDDIFDGSQVIEARTAELMEAATTELEQVLASAACSPRRDRRGQVPPGRAATWSAPGGSSQGPARGRRQRVHHHGALPTRRRGPDPAGQSGRKAALGRSGEMAWRPLPRAGPGGFGAPSEGGGGRVQHHGGKHRAGPCRRNDR